MNLTRILVIHLPRCPGNSSELLSRATNALLTRFELQTESESGRFGKQRAAFVDKLVNVGRVRVMTCPLLNRRLITQRIGPLRRTMLSSLGEGGSEGGRICRRDLSIDRQQLTITPRLPCPIDQFARDYSTRSNAWRWRWPRSLLNSFSVARCIRPPLSGNHRARTLPPTFNYLEYARRIRGIATRSRHHAPGPHNQISGDSFPSTAADRKLRYDEYFPRASRAGTIAV